MTDRRQQLYAITRQLRRWIEWQGGDEDMGAIPASDERRQEFRERAKARRKAKREAIEESLKSGPPEPEPEETAPASESKAGNAGDIAREFGSLRTDTQPRAAASADQSSASGAGGSANGGSAGSASSGGGSPQTNEEKLEFLRNYLGDCRRCPLWKNRNNVVFGEGNAEARLVFVGEAPGYNEDQTGRPFVGKAGQLLNKMIGAMGLERGDTYICNVLKSRPPDNRNPNPDEVAECKPFLVKQLEIIEPEVIVTLGRPAAQNLLETDRGIGQLRGSWHEWHGIAVMPTYHPAYLLRSPSQKGKTWSDLQMVMERLGLG